MEEVLVAIFQFLLEVIGQTLVWNLLYLPFDFLSFRDFPTGRAGFCALAFFGGLLCGWILLIPFPSTSIHSPWLRIATLIASPVLAGWISYVVAELRAGLGHIVESRNHFWYAFTFTLGLAIVRFAYAHHPSV
jgi:hypothetical protein